MSYTVLLPPRIDISEASRLCTDWLSKVQSPSDIEMDCHLVESFSTAAAQLIVSLSLLLGEAGKTLKLTQISPTLREDFLTLGLSDYI